MARREFLQLAKPFKPDKQTVAGWLISEKLDGTRCLWDGGVTRGMRTVDVPYASIMDPKKPGQQKKKIKPFASGLWSRYGNPIMAPDWFLDSLPETPLDGELWAGRGKFQLCRSICAGDKPDPRFNQIRYACYSAPPVGRLLAPGEIKNNNFHCTINDAEGWFRVRQSRNFSTLQAACPFNDEYKVLQTRLRGSQNAFAHEQVKLPDNEADARAKVEAFLLSVLEKGGEGVVIRDPAAHWMPKRVNALLKYKPHLDAEGTITGFTSGRKTDKGSKHLGKIGALILDFEGKRLELSGLTDVEREFLTEEMCVLASEQPGRDMPDWFQGKHFKVGQEVSFKFRELSDDSIPKEARFFRKRDVE